MRLILYAVASLAQVVIGVLFVAAGIALAIDGALALIGRGAR